VSSPLPSDALADRLAALCLELCAVPSVTGDEARLCGMLAARFAEPPWQATRVGNALAVLGPRRAGRPLLTLVGHIDTVPPAEGGPYAQRLPSGDLPAWREGDRLHGLGSSDMKSGLAVMLALAEDLDPTALPWDLGLVFYDKEEGPYADNGLDPLLNTVPWIADSAMAVLLEPSQDVAMLGCLGCLHGWVRFEGRAAHSARSWLGENAIHKAGGFISAVAQQAPRHVSLGGLDYVETVSVTLAKGGRARNVVPDRFELNLNYRFAPDRGLAQAESHLIRYVAEASGGQATLEISDRAPAGPVDADHPAIQHYINHTGVTVEPKLGWTDVARLSLHGIPCINHGPGLAAQAHQAQEHTDLAPLVGTYSRLRALLEDTPPPRLGG
jgi:succinyl-diaminopimelate desuccinylase